MRRYYVFYCSRSVKLKGLGRLSLYGIPVLLLYNIQNDERQKWAKAGKAQTDPSYETSSLCSASAHATYLLLLLTFIHTVYVYKGTKLYNRKNVTKLKW